MQNHFEVKSGANKGFYIVTNKGYSDDLGDQVREPFAGPTWGRIVYENHPGFYKYHHINPHTEVVWTNTRFAGYAVYQDLYDLLVAGFRCFR